MFTDRINFEFPTFELPDLKMPEFTFPSVEIPHVELPDFTLPEFTLPELNMPKVTLPDVKLPEFTLPKIESPITVDQVVGFARDAVYVGVGAAVITAQQVDQRRRDVTTQVDAGLRKFTAR